MNLWPYEEEGRVTNDISHQTSTPYEEQGSVKVKLALHTGAHMAAAGQRGDDAMISSLWSVECGHWSLLLQSNACLCGSAYHTIFSFFCAVESSRAEHRSGKSSNNGAPSYTLYQSTAPQRAAESSRRSMVLLHMAGVPVRCRSAGACCEACAPASCWHCRVCSVPACHRHANGCITAIAIANSNTEYTLVQNQQCTVYHPFELKGHSGV